MRSDRAYRAIDDEHDPAWHGHVEQHERTRRYPVLVGAIVIIAAAAGIFALRSADDAPTRDGAPRAAAPTTTSAAATQTAGAPSPTAAATPANAPAAPTGDTMVPAIVSYSTASTELAATGDDLFAGAQWSYIASGAAGGEGLGVTGDVDGLAPALLSALRRLASTLGMPLEVVSGFRTTAEQQALYDKYTAGTGNLAAVPGTSKHELGQAADVYIGGVALASVPGADIVAASIGLGFPVPGEPWHTELVAAP